MKPGNVSVEMSRETAAWIRRLLGPMYSGGNGLYRQPEWDDHSKDDESRLRWTEAVTAVGAALSRRDPAAKHRQDVREVLTCSACGAHPALPDWQLGCYPTGGDADLDLGEVETRLRALLVREARIHRSDDGWRVELYVRDWKDARKPVVTVAQVLPGDCRLARAVGRALHLAEKTEVGE